MFRFIKKQSTGRIIALGFALAILLGSVLLILPCSVKEGVELSYMMRSIPPPVPCALPV